MYEYIARVVSVHDGDTFRADVDLGFGVWRMNEVFRLEGINAPELGTRLGKPSRDAARAMLMPGQPGEFVIIRTKKDTREKFGRYLARVTVPARDGKGVIDVAESLIASGLAIRWDGQGPRPLVGDDAGSGTT